MNVSLSFKLSKPEREASATEISLGQDNEPAPALRVGYNQSLRSPTIVARFLRLCGIRTVCLQVVGRPA